MLTTSCSSRSMASCCAASQARMAASLASVVIGVPLAARALPFSSLAEPERVPEAVGDSGAVLLGKRPGILGHGDLGDGEHRSRRMKQQPAQLRQGGVFADGHRLREAKTAGGKGNVGAVGGQAALAS